MSAGDVTDEEIQDFSRLFPASRRLATALKASRAESAALRRQVEERDNLVASVPDLVKSAFQEGFRCEGSLGPAWENSQARKVLDGEATPRPPLWDADKHRIAVLEAQLRGTIPDGVACGRPGCLHHVSHPCEGCGRIAGRSAPTADVVTVPMEEWTIAQILANAWGRHPLTCEERDKLVAEWDALRSGEAVATPPNADTVPPVETEFKREDRYIVIKRSDLERHATPAQLRELERTCEMIRFGRMNEGKRLNSYVVVADDWPEYEETWARIQARMTGTQIQDIRPPSRGEVVATPHQDTVTVNADLWRDVRSAICYRDGSAYWSEAHKRFAAKFKAEFDALRTSAQAPAQRGEG